MGQILLGFQALLRVWSDAAFAGRIARLLEGTPPATGAQSPMSAVGELPPQVAAPESKPSRSDALSLLGVLQREGRLLDFLKEGISGFSDAEIGAAVRPVHKDCAAAVERMFGLEPFSPVEEGQPIEVPAAHDPAQFRTIGNTTGTGAVCGTVAHAGWKATRCELPTYNGRTDSAMVLAPVEVEV